ncbi:hypothetical protein DL765_005789 [Monosporascus sp. GIB2]|nr:hypothetical protein DL765_005789 [Monosporascus sp. GIB2]
MLRERLAIPEEEIQSYVARLLAAYAGASVLFALAAVGELMGPMFGGVLYEKTGYVGIFGVASGILGLDFLMRLLIIEKRTAAKYLSQQNGETNRRERGARDKECDGTASEADPLLPRNDGDAFKIWDETGRLVRVLPILVCFRNPRFVIGLALAFVQASLLAMVDATIPTEAEELFGFTSLQAGLLFIITNIPYLVLGPVAGWAVDRYGTKPAAVIGFAYLVPTLVLLRLPSDQLLEGSRNVILYSAILVLNGLGLAIIGSPSIVEVSDVVQKYDKANPEFFGENGPYAQLYEFNSVFFNLGLTVGPLVADGPRDSTGYGNMTLTFAVVSGVTAILSFCFIGGKSPIIRRIRISSVTCR